MIDTDKDIIDEFFDDKYEGLTIDDWYKMNHHDWKDVVNEYNDLLAEVKRLREGIKKQIQFTLECVGSDIGDLYETIADDLRRLIE